MARLLFGLVAVILLSCSLLVGWLLWYTGDTPDLTPLQGLAPDTPADVSARICGTPENVHAIPYADFGENLTQAIYATHGYPERNGSLKSARQLLFERPIDLRERHGLYASLVARNLLCGKQRSAGGWHVATWRTAHRIERTYTPEQVFTMAMNVAPIGPGVRGVADASHRWIGKAPRDLTIDEAALLVAIIHRGVVATEFEPQKVYEARNRIIARMLTQRLISSEAAAQANAAPINFDVLHCDRSPR